MISGSNKGKEGLQGRAVRQPVPVQTHLVLQAKTNIKMLAHKRARERSLRDGLHLQLAGGAKEEQEQGSAEKRAELLLVNANDLQKAILALMNVKARGLTTQ